MASKLFNFSGNTVGHCQLCQNKDEKGQMVHCSDCLHWFHSTCGNVEPNTQGWICPRCDIISKKLKASENPIHDMMEAQKEAFKYITNKAANSQLAALKEVVDTFKSTIIDQRGNSTTMVVENPNGEAILQVNKIVTRQALMDLPDFDGSFKVWPRFQSIFEATTKEGEFSDMENLNRLNKHLQGRALFHVSSLLMDHKNVPKIMKSLKEEFGNVRILYEGFLKEIINLRNPSMEKPQTLIDFINSIENLVANVKLLNQPDYLKDQRLIQDLVGKLPFNIRQQWMKSLLEKEKQVNLLEPNKLPDLEELSDWLKDHKKLATMMKSSTFNEEKNLKKERLNSHSSFTTKYKCFTCSSSEHKNADCPVFSKMDVSKRKAILKKHRICFGCCNFSNHMIKNCQNPRKCNVNGCKMKHHPLLHETKKALKQVNHHNKHDEDILYQILPVTLKNGNKKVEVLALLDLGSSTSLLVDDVRKQLGITGTKMPLALSWTDGNIQRDDKSQQISISI